MVINKKTSKTWKFFVLQIPLFLLKFVVTVFVSYAKISWHVIAESSIIVAKYFPFPQLHVAVFQI